MITPHLTELTALFTRMTAARARFVRARADIAEALDARLRNEGPGPSDAEFDALADVMAASDHAEDAYLTLLAQVGFDVIQLAKAGSAAPWKPS